MEGDNKYRNWVVWGLRVTTGHQQFAQFSGISKQNATLFCKCADYSYTNASTSCEIMLKISVVTSEFMRAKIENLPRLGCNITIIVHLAALAF